MNHLECEAKREHTAVAHIWDANRKAGDTMTLIGIPPNLRDQEDILTRTLFGKCLGQSFVVVKVESIEVCRVRWRN